MRKVNTTKNLICTVGCGLSLALSAQAAVYTSIPGVFNTGVDNSGHLLSPGTVDPHYTITASPLGATAARATTLNVVWIGNTSSSAWINASGNGNDNPPLGSYTFTLNFSLNGFDPSTAVINGQWTGDNTSTIFLNGVNTGITHSTPWESTRFDSFQLNSGFVAGQNTLAFVVDQLPGTSNNPIGLQVNITSALAVVPEPGSLALCSLGGLALVGARSCRKRSRC